MHLLNIRVDAPTAADMQRADVTLWQHAIQSRTTARMRQVLATTLHYHTRWYAVKCKQRHLTAEHA